MSKRKERFEQRVMFADEAGVTVDHLCNGYEHRVIVADARDLTPEKAVEKVLQVIKSESWAKCGQPASAIKQSEFDAGIDRLAKAAGMSAHVVNGKVRVRRTKK